MKLVVHVPHNNHAMTIKSPHETEYQRQRWWKHFDPGRRRPVLFTKSCSNSPDIRTHKSTLSWLSDKNILQFQQSLPLWSHSLLNCIILYKIQLRWSKTANFDKSVPSSTKFNRIWWNFVATITQQKTEVAGGRMRAHWSMLKVGQGYYELLCKYWNKGVFFSLNSGCLYFPLPLFKKKINVARHRLYTIMTVYWYSAVLAMDHGMIVLCWC